jgi:hypothetical protein
VLSGSGKEGRANVEWCVEESLGSTCPVSRCARSFSKLTVVRSARWSVEAKARIGDFGPKQAASGPRDVSQVGLKRRDAAFRRARIVEEEWVPSGAADESHEIQCRLPEAF